MAGGYCQRLLVLRPGDGRRAHGWAVDQNGLSARWHERGRHYRVERPTRAWLSGSVRIEDELILRNIDFGREVLAPNNQQWNCQGDQPLRGSVQGRAFIAHSDRRKSTTLGGKFGNTLNLGTAHAHARSMLLIMRAMLLLMRRILRFRYACGTSGIWRYSDGDWPVSFLNWPSKFRKVPNPTRTAILVSDRYVSSTGRELRGGVLVDFEVSIPMHRSWCPIPPRTPVDPPIDPQERRRPGL